MLTDSLADYDLSDLQKKIYAEKPMCIFLKYLTDKKWVEFKDVQTGAVHVNHDVIQKNIETLAKMNPNDLIDENGKYYNLSEPYKVIILSRIFEFQNDENQKFEIKKSLDENMNEMWTKYKKYPIGVFENILRLHFENIIRTFDKNENYECHQDFSGRDSLANAIKQYLGKHNLGSETKCLLWQYYGYLSAQKNTINEMKSKSDFVDAINIIKNYDIYKDISNQKEKDAFLEGTLKSCDNYKWEFDDEKLSELSNSEQKIIIPHLKDFTCAGDGAEPQKIKKKFSTPDDITNFVIDTRIQDIGICNDYYNLIFLLVFLLTRNDPCKIDDARAKILGINIHGGMFYALGVNSWLDEICTYGECELSNIPDFVVAELVYAACNDDKYDFSDDIEFSVKKSEDEKDKALEITNLLNFLIAFKKERLYNSFTRNEKLKCRKIKAGISFFVILGSAVFSLWLISLISITFCFIELSLFAFYHIIDFIADHLSKRNCIGKIIRCQYTKAFFYIIQFPIIFTFVLLTPVANRINICCSSLASNFDSDNQLERVENDSPQFENDQDLLNNSNQI